MIEAVEALKRHAVGSDDAEGPGLADSIWRFTHGGQVPDLESLTSEVVSLISEIGRGRDWVAGSVPSGLAYSVAEILSLLAELAAGRSSNVILHNSSLAVWRVCTAWEALLAGDIDDIVEHVRLHLVAREAAPWRALDD